MSNTAIQQPSVSQQFQNVSAALRELGITTRQLLVALISAPMQRISTRPAISARREADKLRAYADTLSGADPRFAQDLYAAATRHEMSAGAQ